MVGVSAPQPVEVGDSWGAPVSHRVMPPHPGEAAAALAWGSLLLVVACWPHVVKALPILRRRLGLVAGSFCFQVPWLCSSVRLLFHRRCIAGRKGDVPAWWEAVWLGQWLGAVPLAVRLTSVAFWDRDALCRRVFANSETSI